MHLGIPFYVETEFVSLIRACFYQSEVGAFMSKIGTYLQLPLVGFFNVKSIL